MKRSVFGTELPESREASLLVVCPSSSAGREPGPQRVGDSTGHLPRGQPSASSKGSRPLSTSGACWAPVPAKGAPGLAGHAGARASPLSMTRGARVLRTPPPRVRGGAAAAGRLPGGSPPRPPPVTRRDGPSLPPWPPAGSRFQQCNLVLKPPHLPPRRVRLLSRGAHVPTQPGPGPSSSLSAPSAAATGNAAAPKLRSAGCRLQPPVTRYDQTPLQSHWPLGVGGSHMGRLGV